MYVKICGLSDTKMALHAANSGANAIGVVMYQQSPRHTSMETAAEISNTIGREFPEVDRVLVVRDIPAVDAASIAQRLGFDVLQLHGGYTREDFSAAALTIPRVWRATSLAAEPEVQAGMYGEEHLLIDSPRPGSGEGWDLSRVPAGILGSSWILAGGLDPQNVAATAVTSQCWGVDVSSGVEYAPGMKDAAQISNFIRAARSAGGSPPHP